MNKVEEFTLKGRNCFNEKHKELLLDQYIFLYDIYKMVLDFLLRVINSYYFGKLNDQKWNISCLPPNQNS